MGSLKEPALQESSLLAVIVLLDSILQEASSLMSIYICMLHCWQQHKQWSQMVQVLSCNTDTESFSMKQPIGSENCTLLHLNSNAALPCHAQPFPCPPLLTALYPTLPGSTKPYPTLPCPAPPHPI